MKRIYAGLVLFFIVGTFLAGFFGSALKSRADLIPYVPKWPVASPVYKIPVVVEAADTATPTPTGSPTATMTSTPLIGVNVNNWPTPDTTKVANGTTQMSIFNKLDEFLNSFDDNLLVDSQSTTTLLNTMNGKMTRMDTGAVTVFPGALPLTFVDGGSNFIASTLNSSTVQLAAGTTFVGTIENTWAQRSYSILLTSDQNGTMILNQYIDSGGTRLAGAVTYTITAGNGFCRSGPLNANYLNVSFQNTGGLTTTTFNLNVAYGTIDAANQLNDIPIGLMDVGGVALTLGQKTMANSIPFVLASDQGPVSVYDAPASTLLNLGNTYSLAVSTLLNLGNTYSLAVSTLLNTINTKITRMDTGSVTILGAVPAHAVTVWGGGPVTVFVNSAVTLGAGTALTGGEYIYTAQANRAVSATGMAASILGSYPFKTCAMAVSSIGGTGAVTCAMYAWVNPTYAGPTSIAAITITGSAGNGQTFIANQFPAYQYGVSVLGIAAATTIQAFVMGAQF